MKKTLLIIGIAILFSKCSSDELLNPQPINLGVNSNNTSILNVNSKSIKSVSVDFLTTIGSKYSVEIFEAPDGKISLKNMGFTSNTENTNKIYNLSDLPNGLYDIVLTDVSGNVSKMPIVINK